MAEAITCPVCGESNPADMEFCRNCQSRLRPLTGALKGENAPIQPGEPPTKKVTSELEPLLPQWLREARQLARESTTADMTKSGDEEKATPPSSSPDLLAGLATQSREDEEEVPDWLARITGAPSKKKSISEDNQVKWVELGREAEPGESPSSSSSFVEVNQTPKSPTPEKDDLSDWFKQAAASSETADFPMPPAASTAAPPVLPGETPRSTEAAHPAAEDLAWLRDLDATANAPQPEQPSTPAAPLQDDVPDWLKRLQAEQVPPPLQAATETPPVPPANVPDWLRELDKQKVTLPPAESAAQEPALSDAQLPDWLKSAEPESLKSQPVQAEPEEAIIPTELPDWLAALGGPQQSPQQPSKPAPSVFEVEESATPAATPPGEAPDWISSLREGQEPSKVEDAPILPETELPDWISSLGASGELPAAESPVTPPATGLPDWVSSLGTGERPPKAEEPATPFSTGLPDWVSSLRAEPEPLKADQAPASPSVEVPDWVSSLSAQRAEPKPAESAAPSAPASEGSEAQTSTTEPAIVGDALSNAGVDELLSSAETPEWLSAVLPASPAAGESLPAAAQEEEAIGPAELPSWVQAMRPVETAMAGAAATTENVPTEQRGPLAGLRGVLPAIPGAAVPSSKPKAHSIKLDATEQQQAHAALLEQILAAETSPIPMKSAAAVLQSQKVLRWAVSVLLLVVLGAALFARTESFPLPGGVPNETIGAMQAVEAIPADAPVLVVFEYEPSTVGEMEATGASLMDHLLLMKHPQLALLSTSPTGAALAERFMSSTLASRAYARDVQYVDLGYLPGGLAGVYNFAQSPRTAISLDARARPVWQSAMLAGVERFSDFAGIIVLTDSLESGRTWVEQTQGARGNSSLVLIASAQAGPMLLPYVDSGQVSGMVSGIYGAVGAEQRNAGQPGFVRRYWDAYSLGLYLAVLLIVLGGLWNGWLGLRDRREGGGVNVS